MSSILTTIQNLAGTAKDKAMGVLDSLFPPEKRNEMIARLQSWAVNNPKLAGFLLTNLALTGLPLAMFFLFTLTVFVFSLIAALLVGLLVALLFTAFMVGVALLVILPTVFLTTLAASFVTLWGLGGYYIVKWFNSTEAGSGVENPGSAIGDKLNSLTGGRMNFLMEGARKNEAQGQAKKSDGDGQGQKNGNGSSNGTAKQQGGGGVDDIAKNVDVGNVTDKVGKTANAGEVKKRTGGATNTAQGAVGGVKGAVGGTTGLV